MTTSKSEHTIRDLHTQGKEDRQLSISFDRENFILEYLRKLRMKGEIGHHLYKCQWLKTREIYQSSDEYKKTRGY